MVTKSKIAGSRKAASRRPRRGWFAFLCGALLALVFLELLLHNFSGKFENGSGFELRNDREGIAKAHFLSNGLRLTGNPEISGAPRLFLLGDSHVEAFQVSDEQTMGSVLERRLRAHGKPWDVLQYGWSGADGPDYVYAAPVVEQFHPGRIVLLMDRGDFASTVTPDARLVERGGQVVAEAARPGAVPGREPSFGGATERRLKESGLFYSAALRFALEIRPQFTEHRASAEEADLGANTALASERNVKLIVEGLKEAYGDKLRILYAPGQPYSANTPVETQEAALLRECRAQGVACRSLRTPMLRELLENHKLSRGFSNSEPGVGHFNVDGHAVVAEEMYEWLNESH